MTKCENCYHAEICKKYPNTGLPPKMRDERLGEGCEHFKDKSLIVELPCKANDTLYTFSAIARSVISFNAPDIHWIIDSVNEFGKTVFLSYRDAERALNEREERV